MGFTFAVSDAVSTFCSSMLDLASDVFDESRFEVAALLLVRFFLCGLSLSFAAVSASALGGSEGCEYLSFSWSKRQSRRFRVFYCLLPDHLPQSRLCC